jgi:hypothetical protein
VSARDLGTAAISTGDQQPPKEIDVQGPPTQAPERPDVRPAGAHEGARYAECGTLRGYRHHAERNTPPCDPCQDAMAVSMLDRSLCGLRWPAERVKLSVLFTKRPDLATLPLVGPRIAAGLAESI